MGTVGVHGHSASSSNPSGRVGVLDYCRRKCNPDRNARNKNESHKRSLVYTCHRQELASVQVANYICIPWHVIHAFICSESEPLTTSKQDENKQFSWITLVPRGSIDSSNTSCLCEVAITHSNQCLGIRSFGSSAGPAPDCKSIHMYCISQR